MNYKKDTAVLSPVSASKPNANELFGLARVEHEDFSTTLYLSLINCPFLNSGEYYLAILFDSSPQHLFAIGKKPTGLIKTFTDLAPYRDFSVAICSVDNGKPTPVAFGKTKNGEKLETLLSGIVKDLATSIAQPNANYDDEAVATENYYSIDQDIQQKLTAIKGWENEFNSNENTSIDNQSGKDAETGQDDFNGGKNAESHNQSQNYSERNPYYQSAKKELDSLFSKFPQDHSLNQTMPNGKFCKIPYAENKYYVVGTVEELGAVKYICYGVPSEYSQTPPKELEGYCTFIPLSLFNLHGQGFWIMFQDAVTGKCIKKAT